MPVTNLQPIYLAPFNGRNGKDNPIFLETQAQEQVNIHSIRGWLESRGGEQLWGTATGNINPTGLSKWDENLVRARDTVLEIYTSDWSTFKTGLTSHKPTTFLEFYGDIYISNGVDTVMRGVRTTTTSSITGASTTIPTTDPTKFLNEKSKVYIDGDEIDYIGISATPIISKVFADSPYAATITETTINYNATGGNSTVNLFTAVGNAGQILIIRKTDASVNTVTVDANGAQTIDLGDTAGATLTKVLSAQGDCIVIRSDGANWVITTLVQAGATVIDNVTNITSNHASTSVVTQTQDLPFVPKGRALAEYGRKLWVTNISSTQGAREPYFLYYGASSNDKSPEKFHEFRTNIVDKLLEADDFTIEDITVTTNYTITTFDSRILVDATGGNRTVTLPTAVGNTDLTLVIKKKDSTTNTVTIDGAGAETIDGVATVVLSVQNAVCVIRSDGANWVTTSYEPTGANRELFALGDSLTGLLKYRDFLLIAKKDGMRYVKGFIDADPIPIPDVADFYKEDGAVNEDCLILVNKDALYFTGTRIRRLFVEEYEGLKLDDTFDRPIQDILSRLSQDQSEACMVYNQEKDIMYLSVKSKGSQYNDVRICYSSNTGSWWVEDKTYCRKYVVLNGETYYAHSLTGRVMKEDSGTSRNGFSDITYYKSKIVQPVPFGRQDFRHLNIDGTILYGTVIECCVYVDGNMVFCATIDSDDILSPIAIPDSGSVGDVVFGDQPYGGIGGSNISEPIDIQKQFKKWIPIGRKGFNFYYTLRSVGTSYAYRIKSAQLDFVPIVEPSRPQSSS